MWCKFLATWTEASYDRLGTARTLHGSLALPGTLLKVSWSKILHNIDHFACSKTQKISNERLTVFGNPSTNITIVTYCNNNQQFCRIVTILTIDHVDSCGLSLFVERGIWHKVILESGITKPTWGFTDNKMMKTRIGIAEYYRWQFSFVQ